MGNRIDRIALTVAGIVTRRRWLVLLGSLVVLFAAASGVRLLDFSNNYRVFFGKDNPDLIAFESFQETYTKNDNILFVLRPESGPAFTPRLAAAVEQLTEESWNIPFAIRVDSVTNFQHSWADGDDLIVEDLIRDGASMTQAQLDARIQIALKEPVLAGALIAHDARTTGVLVTLQFPEESITEVPQAVAVARELADKLRAEHPDLTVALSGLSMLNNAFAEAGVTDVKTLIPVMYLILVVMTVVSLRSFWSSTATLVVIAASTLTAMGLAGYVGILLTPVSVTAPTIILTLSIADSIHILVSFLAQLRQGQHRLDAMRESVRLNFLPVTITSVTTIVGFLTLNFSDAPPMRDLGNITAMGIAAAWLYSLTLLPALLSLLPIRARATQRTSWTPRLLERIADFVIAHRQPILVTLGLAALALVALVPTLDLNDQFVRYFDDRIQFRSDADFAMEHLNGIYRVEYSIPSGEPGGISEPEYLHNLQSLTSWLREQPEITHVTSYTDVIQRLNRNMHGDDEAYYRIPDDRELAAQYLLLYELSLPYGLDLNNQIDIDKSATRLSFNVPDITSVKFRELLDRIDGWTAARLPESMSSSPTGASVMFSYISMRNITSMLRGNAIAIFLIAGILIFTLRSWKLGVLSLLPNAVPILMTFGLWSIFVGEVGMAAATVSATSMGIVVDDTVHFLVKYLRARRERKLAPPAAVRYAFETVGQAILTTTFILIAGFAILAGSAFRINAQLGLMTALAIGCALIFDFFLLPALLMTGHREERQHETEQEAIAQTV